MAAELFDLSGVRALVTGGGRGLGRGMATALADRDELRRGFDEAVDRLGGLEVLVVSHGMGRRVPALDHDLSEWDEVLRANLTSVFELCRLAGKIMVPQGGGKIVTVASMLSFSGGLNVSSYAASKGGVGQLTKALANEWAPHGVNVNAIAPGYFRTALTTGIWRDDPERYAQILARIPAGRWGEPSDLAGAIVFLASRASDYVHGIVLPVDGGWLSR